MTTIEKEVKPGNALAKKEWHAPRLLKLPIKATAVTYHTGGNDGNMNKSGSAAHTS